jgi:hypothetical protein
VQQILEPDAPEHFSPQIDAPVITMTCFMKCSFLNEDE